MTSDEIIVGDLLDSWQQAIGEHDSGRVAALFTEDAVFQGLRPYTIGPAGVADYYAAQPAGMTVAYRVRLARRLADDVVLGWVAADFTFAQPERQPVPVNLTVIARNGDDGWRIAHYHVSPR
ncbi:SgcJ/EcaC family oxidoreductase [Actinoplanes awajinensis]|uniref:SnoaL-like domain-containing protein n=1 Tax=Actinoplanes awajinensis subsp. mycoplanecinus TaxID=135947 RepID=A0A101J8S0_9ACTN|nr:SgcJ/EcaC family oxidoreductase [Actinoplanes awajinensis]KUL22335.1 hypothetical protein ADL15_48230 [Actinoplanes awajinensis subsp. mycoplanecinus]